MGEFDIWFRKHEREVFKNNQGCFDTAYKFGAKQAFISQQSKIEQLEKRISDALKVLDDASPTMLDKKAIRILRGES